MTAPDLSARHRAALDVSTAPRLPRAIEPVPEKGHEPVPEKTSETSVEIRLALLEGSVRFAKGVLGGIGIAVVAGALNMVITLTRVEDRYDRLTRDVANTTTQAATAKETSDRLTERFVAISERVERIDRALAASLPTIQSSLEALRAEIAGRATPLTPHR